MKKFILVLALGISALQVFAGGDVLKRVKIVKDGPSIVNEGCDVLSIVNENADDLSIVVLDANGKPVSLVVVYNSTTNTVSFAPNQTIIPQVYTIIVTNNKTKAIQIYRIRVL